MLNNYQLVYVVAITVLLFVIESPTVQSLVPDHFHDKHLKKFQREKSLTKLLNTMEMKVRNGRLPYLSERDVQLLSFLAYDMNKQKSTKNKTPPQFWHSRQGR